MITRRVQASMDADQVWSMMNTSDRLVWLDKIVSSSVTVSQFDSAIAVRQIDSTTLASLAEYEFSAQPVSGSRSQKYECLRCHNPIYRANFRAHIWPLNGDNRCKYWKTRGASSRLCELSVLTLGLCLLTLVFNP
jgi:hypothetical protein